MASTGLRTTKTFPRGTITENLGKLVLPTAAVWFRRWQVFYMACAEPFAYDGGDTWSVAHYLLGKPELQLAENFPHRTSGTDGHRRPGFVSISF